MALIDAATPGFSDDLSKRRAALFELHSVLRSTDNLRPDEAFDELIKLYELAVVTGLSSYSEARASAPDLALSESAFTRATEMLGPILLDNRTDLGADVFQELVDVGVRSGMGQYFTPAPVARAAAKYLRPEVGEAWLDPFCGSGLLLGEIARAADGAIALYGVDRDHRVLRLALLEARIHHPESPLHAVNGNALWSIARLQSELAGPAEGFHGVVTNPPFGSEIHIDDYLEHDGFRLATREKTPLEVLGLERSVQLLRPGGRLGIVLPQSIVSNRGSTSVREFLLDSCQVDAVISLPPATFGPYKGVGKAVLIFATKLPADGPRAGTRFAVASEIGWDGSGRPTGSEDVTEVAVQLARQEQLPRLCVDDRDALVRNLSPEWHLRPRVEGRRMGDLAATIFTGRSPGRAAYVDGDASPETAYRVLKVGDLTGKGVDWSPGDRRFATLSTRPSKKLLAVGDIALTAAAHHPRYIGAKVDLVDELPASHRDQVFPAAEVLVIRPDPSQVEPVALLLWLRSDAGRSALQACVTGQTAHLYADDVADIVVPYTVLDADISEAAALLRESLKLRRLSEEAARRARASFEAA